MVVLHERALKCASCLPVSGKRSRLLRVARSWMGVDEVGRASTMWQGRLAFPLMGRRRFAGSLSRPAVGPCRFSGPGLVSSFSEFSHFLSLVQWLELSPSLIVLTIFRACVRVRVFVSLLSVRRQSCLLLLLCLASLCRPISGAGHVTWFFDTGVSYA